MQTPVPPLQACRASPPRCEEGLRACRGVHKSTGSRTFMASSSSCSSFPSSLRRPEPDGKTCGGAAGGQNRVYRVRTPEDFITDVCMWLQGAAECTSCETERQGFIAGTEPATTSLPLCGVSSRVCTEVCSGS